MISIGALNAASCTDDSITTVFHEVRQEERENEALALYNEALQYQGSKDFTRAEAKFLSVLDTDLVENSPDSLPEGEELSKHPDLFMKYNVYKNLAAIKLETEEKEKALDYYLEAAVVDESDVSLWWAIGEISTPLLNLRLSRFAYEKGLIYSQNHWPCLDKLITTLYIIGDYSKCLELIATAFETKDCYTKGYAIRDQIFKEEPHFKRDFVHHRALYMVDEDRDEEEYQRFIEDALVIREKRKLLTKREETPKLKLNKPIAFFTWLDVGESLLHLYSEITDSSENLSLAKSIDLSKYKRTMEQQASLSIPSPDTLQKKYMRCPTKESEAKKASRKRNAPISLEKDCEDPLQPKRRSTRVKMSRTKECDTNWCDLLYSFLPESRKTTPSPTDTETDSQDSQDSSAVLCTEKQSPHKSWGDPVEVRKESVVVSTFLNNHMNNSGCISLIGKYLMALVDIWDSKWCSGLATIYRCLYDKYRKHSQFPEPLTTDSPVYMKRFAKVILMALEFQMDYMLLSKASYGASPSTTTDRSGGTKLGEDDFSRFLSDMHYLAFVAAANGLFIEPCQLFATRFYWLQGRYCVLHNETVPAMTALSNCLCSLEVVERSEVFLHNCHTENVISAEAIEAKMETVQQCHTLEELRDLMEQGNYASVIKSLEPIIIDQPMNKLAADMSASVERSSQLVLLQEAYWKSKDFKKCLLCSDIGLGETLSVLPTNDNWKADLPTLLTHLNVCLSSKEAQCAFDENLLVQLTDKLVKLIEIIMDSDNVDDGAQVTTMPWLLLLHIIRFNFSKEKSEKEEDEEESEDDISTVYSNRVLSYLRSAHEYLGRKHWCCNDNGVLLQEFVNEGMREMDRSQLLPKEQELLTMDLEQCFYCLYGNPCKKSKSKAIQEHGNQPVPLTWETSKTLYKFYKPTGLPEPDLRAHTISFEVQSVFRKIVTVVPQHEVEVIGLDVLQQYIDGVGDFPAVTEADVAAKENGVDDLFYYLGDYYFKNKEFTKALKFYMHDVSVKPFRFQSWAAMAFTRHTRLEEKINECEMKSGGLIKKHTTSTLRCFAKAVTIQKNRCVILEEYGQATYMLASYCARKLREDNQDEKEESENFKSMRTEMLLLSQSCFTDALVAANSKEGELWMHYYMLGKTSEHLCKPVDTYLSYYQRSVEELWNSGARVWKKIPYHGAPEYSIESLELFYRIHASILKIIMYSEKIDYGVLEKHLDLVAEKKLYADMLEIDKVALKESEVQADLQAAERERILSMSSDVRKVIDFMLDNVCGDSTKETVISVATDKTQETKTTDIECIDIEDDSNETCNNKNRDISEEVRECLQNIIHNVVKGMKTPINKPARTITTTKKCNTKRRKLDLLCKRPVLTRTFSDEHSKKRYMDISQRCLDAFGFCLRRFPEHFKSQYTMAHFLMYNDIFKNLQWSYDLMLGSSFPSRTSYSIPLPSRGIFCGKKKANLFQCLWKIPVSEIDRPGCFSTHVCKMVSLLLDVLYELTDNQLLLQLSAFLHKTPDKEKKYFRDNDRAFLAIKAFDFTLDILKTRTYSFCPGEDDESGRLLYEVHEAYKHAQKMQLSVQRVEEYLLHVYRIMFEGDVEVEDLGRAQILEEIVKICQQLKPVA